MIMSALDLLRSNPAPTTNESSPMHRYAMWIRSAGNWGSRPGLGCVLGDPIGVRLRHPPLNAKRVLAAPG